MMKDRHILLARKEGNQVYYRIANPKLLQCFDMMRERVFQQIINEFQERHRRDIEKTKKLRARVRRKLASIKEAGLDTDEPVLG